MDFAIDFITNVLGNPTVMLGIICLLYTSDAADE